jgi:hypothetical protein
LVQKLLEAVFKRKRDPRFRGRDATQRFIIEDALEHYFSLSEVPSPNPEKDLAEREEGGYHEREF